MVIKSYYAFALRECVCLINFRNTNVNRCNTSKLSPLKIFEKFSVLVFKMNLFQLIADLTHALAILSLLWSIIKNKSYVGISAKTQLMYSVVFITRYVDLFFFFGSYYNSVMKILYIVSTSMTFLLVTKHYDTYDKKNDSFYSEFLYVLALFLALFINHSFTPIEVLWTFSQYLEAVTIIPQIHLIMMRKTISYNMIIYLMLLIVYKFFYCINWVYRYENTMFFDFVSEPAGIVDILVIVISSIVIWCSDVTVINEGNGNQIQKNIFFINYDYGKQQSITPDIAPLVKKQEII